jgi:hypothetical protein
MWLVRIGTPHRERKLCFCRKRERRENARTCLVGNTEEAGIPPVSSLPERSCVVSSLGRKKIAGLHRHRTSPPARGHASVAGALDRAGKSTRRARRCARRFPTRLASASRPPTNQPAEEPATRGRAQVARPGELRLLGDAGVVLVALRDPPQRSVYGPVRGSVRRFERRVGLPGRAHLIVERSGGRAPFSMAGALGAAAPFGRRMTSPSSAPTRTAPPTWWVDQE